jgi:hypothetical protein
VRLDVEAGGGPRFWSVGYDDGTRREPVGGWAGGALRLSLGLPRLDPWILIQARGGMGAQLSPGLAARDDRLYAEPAPVFEAGLAFPFFLR